MNDLKTFVKSIAKVIQTAKLPSDCQGSSRLIEERTEVERRIHIILAATKKTKSRRESEARKKSDKTEATSTKPVSVKRSIKDKCLKDRAVRFRSTDEEFVFEIEPDERIVIPDGSDIFQKILKDMQVGIENNTTDAEDDDVFDGVFTASVGRLEKKTEVKKVTFPRKSILKRRSSYRR